MSFRPLGGWFVAGGDDGAAATHAAKDGGGLHAEVPGLGGDEVAPHVLGGIELGSVGRQPFDDDAPAGAGNEVLNQADAVDRSTVPDDGPFPRNMPLEVAEELDDLGALAAAGVDLEVEPVQGQTADHGKAFPAEGFLDHRRLATGRTGAYPGGTGAQSAFVDEDEGSVLFAGSFFIAGHSTRFQWRILAWSRSTTRRSGRWQLKPLSHSRRQTWPE